MKHSGSLRIFFSVVAVLCLFCLCTPPVLASQETVPITFCFSTDRVMPGTTYLNVLGFESRHEMLDDAHIDVATVSEMLQAGNKRLVKITLDKRITKLYFLFRDLEGKIIAIRSIDNLCLASVSAGHVISDMDTEAVPLPTMKVNRTRAKVGDRIIATVDFADQYLNFTVCSEDEEVVAACQAPLDEIHRDNEYDFAAYSSGETSIRVLLNCGEAQCLLLQSDAILVTQD